MARERCGHLLPYDKILRLRKFMLALPLHNHGCLLWDCSSLLCLSSCSAVSFVEPLKVTKSYFVLDQFSLPRAFLQVIRFS